MVLAAKRSPSFSLPNILPHNHLSIMANNESGHITLVSSDGFSFVITREAALVSGTLRGMVGAGSK